MPQRRADRIASDIRAGKYDVPDRPRALRAAINALQKAGLPDQVNACSDALAQITTNEGDLVSLAAAAIVKKDWNAAAQLSTRAIEKDRSRAAPRYFRGYSLVQLGREKEGHEQIEIAQLLPLADDTERYEFAQQLEKAGLADASRQQQDLLLRTGDFSGWELGNLTRMAAHRASQSGDDLSAANFWERSTLPCLRDNTTFVDTAAYLGVPHLIHRTRARGLLKAGNSALSGGAASAKITFPVTSTSPSIWPPPCAKPVAKKT
jgi:hypothetical protein